MTQSPPANSTATKNSQPNKGPDHHQLARQLQQLLCNRQSLMLSSTNAQGQPLASYAPFYFDPAEQGALYIYISELAAHTSNLLVQPNASVLLIEDEATCSNPFKRQRLNCHVMASEISRNSEQWQQHTANLQQKLGATMQVLKSLSDFRLFKLTPEEGTLICGFGKAYRIQGLRANHFEAVTGR